MGFHNIVWKMAKVNYKKYIFYFLCNAIVVMIFFMFSTIFFNEDILKVKKEEALDTLLAVPAVALVVFTIFFITYAHSIFIRKRKQEFALFMTLGMTKRDIAKLLLLENSMMILSSIIVGLLFGVTFSRLFFLLLIKGIEFDRVHFHLNAAMFFGVIGLFLLIQLIVIGRSLYLILYGKLIENLKSDRVGQQLKLQSTAIGVFGIVMIVFSVICLYMNYNYNPSADYLYLCALFTFFGLYISLSQFINLFLKLAKKNLKFYYSKIMLFTNLQYKFYKLSSILLLISIMFMITIWYSTIILFAYKNTEKEYMEISPFDIAYIQTDTKNNIAFDEVKNILETKDNKIQNHLVIPIYAYYEYDQYYHWYSQYTIIPIDAFNKLTSKNYKLKKNEFILFLNSKLDYSGDFEEYDKFTFQTKNSREITLKRKYSYTGQKINLVGGIYDCLVVTNEQFNFLRENVSGLSSNVHLINMENWKKSKKEIEQLSNVFSAFNKKTPKITAKHVVGSSEEEFFEVESKSIALKRIKNNYGLQFFVTTFLSILFFIGAFILLYLNLFSEVDKQKKIYIKLFKIGITKKELIKMISSEMKLIYFLPTVIGAILAFLYFTAMILELDGITENLEALLYFFSICSVYFIIQFIFYLYSKRKMLRVLTE